MKLPWDSKYLEVSFHVVLTIVVIYILKLVVDFVAYIFTHFGNTMGVVGLGFSKTFALFSPLIIALVIAYLMDPAANFFQKHYDKFSLKFLTPRLKKYKLYAKIQQNKKVSPYKKRTAGALLSYLAVVLVIFTFVMILVMRIGSNNTGSFLGDLKASIATLIHSFDEFYDSIEVQLEAWGLLDYLSKYLNQFLKAIGHMINSIASGIINFITSAGSGLVNFFLGVVIAFYIIMDKQFVLAKANEFMDIFFPKKINKSFKNFFGDIHHVFSGYIQGTLIDASIVAIMLSIWLSIVGINFAVIIGIVSGFSNIIPYVGAIVGFVLAVITALLSGDPMKALWAAIGILCIQQIDGVFIQPKVVGQNVKLSPVFVLLSLSVAGSLFGLAGMILAVPVCAIIKLFLSRFIERRKKLKEEKSCNLSKGDVNGSC